MVAEVAELLDSVPVAEEVGDRRRQRHPRGMIWRRAWLEFTRRG